MNVLLVLNDPPYGTERSYNAMRLASALVKREGTAVRIFLMGDAATCAKAGQKVPQGYYHLERMLRVPLLQGAAVASRMDVVGRQDARLLSGSAGMAPAKGPSRWWHWGKVLFERAWLSRWF